MECLVKTPKRFLEGLDLNGVSMGNLVFYHKVQSKDKPLHRCLLNASAVSLITISQGISRSKDVVTREKVYQ